MEQQKNPAQKYPVFRCPCFLFPQTGALTLKSEHGSLKLDPATGALCLGAGFFSSFPVFFGCIPKYRSRETVVVVISNFCWSKKIIPKIRVSLMVQFGRVFTMVFQDGWRKTNHVTKSRHELAIHQGIWSFRSPRPSFGLQPIDNWGDPRVVGNFPTWMSQGVRING